MTGLKTISKNYLKTCFQTWQTLKGEGDYAEITDKIQGNPLDKRDKQNQGLKRNYGRGEHLSKSKKKCPSSDT